MTNTGVNLPLRRVGFDESVVWGQLWNRGGTRANSRGPRHGGVVEAAGVSKPNSYKYNEMNLEAAGPEIPEGDREARLLRGRHAGGVPSVEAAGPEIPGGDREASLQRSRHAGGVPSVEAAGPEIPAGDREARLLRSRHAGGVPSVEAAGIEPASERSSAATSTCVFDCLISPREAPTDRILQEPALALSRQHRRALSRPARRYSVQPRPGRQNRGGRRS
jgi:hypothetical protein